jgi:capsular polysaccharide biosynthesis protein
MELRAYWRIIYRRWWIVVLLPLIVVAASFLLRPQTTHGALANLRLAVGIVPENSDGKFYTYDRYYSWLTAEYLADDLSEIVRSRVFADDVSKHLERLGARVSPGQIQGATNPQKQHRLLSISVSAATEMEALDIANAIVDTLRENGGTYMAQLSAQNAALSVIDPPALVPVGPSTREKLDLPLRGLLALAAALGLAFLLEYLDDSVRAATDVEGMGLAVLGEIPK